MADLARDLHVGDKVFGYGRVLSVMLIHPTAKFAGRVKVQFAKEWAHWPWNEEVALDV